MAVNAVSDSQIASSTANIHVLALIDCDHSSHSCYEDGAVNAFLNKQTVYVYANVHVGIFATDQADVFARWSVCQVSDCDTLV